MLQSNKTNNIRGDHLWLNPTVRKKIFSDTSRIDLGAIRDINGGFKKELVFDIDAGDYLKERMCLENCSCGTDNTKICIVCWNAIFVRLARKLVNGVLCKEFGVATDQIMCFFSGRRGFHVHTTDKNYLTRTNEDRSDIADYIISRHNLKIDRAVTVQTNHKLRCPFSLHQTHNIVMPIDLRQNNFNETDVFQTIKTANTLYTIEHYTKNTLNTFYY